MYTVNFLLKNSPNSLTFSFKAFKNANDLYTRAFDFSSDTLDVEDDYGLIGTIKMSEVSAVTFSDFGKEMDRNGEMGLIQAKSNLKTQNIAKNDVGLRMMHDQANSGIITN